MPLSDYKLFLVHPHVAPVNLPVPAMLVIRLEDTISGSAAAAEKSLIQHTGQKHHIHIDFLAN